MGTDRDGCGDRESVAKQGGNTSSVEYSPGTLKRIRAARARQEARWAARSGPVTTTLLSPEQAEQRTRILTREQIRQVPCPACHAEPGQGCHRPGNKASHRARVQDARSTISS